MASLSTNHPMSKITKLAITQRPVQPKKLTKLSYIFYTFLPIYGSKLKIPIVSSGQSALNGPANGPVVINLKIPNRLC